MKKFPLFPDWLNQSKVQRKCQQHWTFKKTHVLQNSKLAKFQALEKCGENYPKYFIGSNVLKVFSQIG